MNNNDQPPGFPEPPRVLGMLLTPPPSSQEDATPKTAQPTSGDDSIATLVSMGFSLSSAQMALRTNDSLEAAISWLFENEGNAEMTGGDDDDDYELVHDELKMVLVVRMDLGMTPGKVASQSVHAALGCYRLTSMQNPSLQRAWEDSGEATVCLKCKSETEMDALESAAISSGLLTYAVHDAGRTEVAEGSKTVLCIGPNQASRINAITGKLKLY